MPEGTGSGSTATGRGSTASAGTPTATGTGSAGGTSGTGRAGQAAGAAKEQAADVAGTAKNQAASVAGSAKEQAGDVLAEAKSQAVDLFADLRRQLSEQSDGVRDRLAEFLTGAGDELGDMAGAGGGSGYATQIVRQVGDRASNWGAHLRNHDGNDLLQQTRSFARRKPGTFLLGAVAAGVLAGRLTRGAKAHHDDTTASVEKDSTQLSSSAQNRPVPDPVTTGPLVPHLDEDVSPSSAGGEGYSVVDSPVVVDPLDPAPRHLPDVSER